MTSDQIDRVFGRGRLKMVTGEHVEVFREAVAPGERRRYTKRFLNSTDGDFAQWTEREWRILARLVGHGITCVPEVVQFDRGSAAGAQHVQTYDAGVTVDQWATLLPLRRDGRLFRHAFEDCAHWWALAHHCLIALQEIHQLQLVHLDIKGDNVCIPLGPENFDPDTPGLTLFPVFRQLALIDFAFSLVSRESLTAPLPIGWQREYDYQSPRLLQALEDGHDGDLARTRELDWRCDIYSLAAMLKRYLPDEARVHQPELRTGWTHARYDAAKALILTLREHHDRDAPQVHPHQELIDATGARLGESDLAHSLACGWTFARDFNVAPVGASPLTPMTRLAVPLRVFVSPRDRAAASAPVAAGGPHGSAAAGERDVAFGIGGTRGGADPDETLAPLRVTQRADAMHARAPRHRAGAVAIAGTMLLALGAVVAHEAFPEASRAVLDGVRAWRDPSPRQPSGTTVAAAAEKLASAPASPAASAAEEPAAPPDRTPAPPAADEAASAAPAAPAPMSARTPEPASESASASAPSPRSAPARESAPAPEAAAAAESAPVRAAAPAPQAAPANPKAAAPASEAPRSASGKRAAAKAPPASQPRGSKSVATAKAPPPSRSAAASQRTAPAATASYVGGKPARSSDPAPRVQPQDAPIPNAEPAAPATEAPPQATQVTVAPAAPAVVVAPPMIGTVIPAPTIAPAPSAQVPAAPAAAPAMTATAPAAPARRERAPAKPDNPSAETGLLSRLLGLVKRTPAPIEDRSTQSATAAGKAAAGAAAPGTRLYASAVDDAQAQARAQASAASPPPAQAAAPAAPLLSAPPPPPTAPLFVPTPAPMPAPRMLAPPPPVADALAEYRAPERTPESDYTTQARRTLAQTVPRIAREAQGEITRVLWAAANAPDPKQERAVIDVAQSVWVRESAAGVPQATDPATARRFNDEALKAYWVRRNIPEAYDLQLKAFGANPNDPEITGNLAVLHLKLTPSQPETARQLALHALALRGARYRGGRIEDWNTYAIASALTGRDADARNALYVTVALARNVERNCRDAASAIANYGDRMREPVDAMLYRIYMQGRSYESPHCTWPPRWAATTRLY